MLRVTFISDMKSHFLRERTKYIESYFLALKHTTVLLLLSSPILKLVSFGKTSVTLWIKYRWKPPSGWNINALHKGCRLTRKQSQ